jgi:NitT/TauT family transport system substrate-binding protein
MKPSGRSPRAGASSFTFDPMRIARRTLILSALAAQAHASPLPTIRIGVLHFGTVSWELDVIRHHALDDAAQIVIAPMPLASPQAAQISLQAGQVDMIVLDWLWVARQRADNADWTFVPFSNAVGALVAPDQSPVRTVSDLQGRTLGIAGTPLDKSWIILRAYAMQKLGIDLDAKVNKNFGPPPLLAEQMRAGRLDAALTFWPFAAKAMANGARSILSIDDAVTELGVGPGAPYIGYTFSERWAAQNKETVERFLTASRQARAILATSDAEWQRLRPLTGAADDAELVRLRDWYRRGIPRRWGDTERQAAVQLFDLLATTGGPDLVGPIRAIPSGTFWPVTWQAES